MAMVDSPYVVRPPGTSAVAALWTTRQTAFALIGELERELSRAYPALSRLRSAIWAWRDPVAIDDGVGDVLDVIDPVIEPRAAYVVAVLHRIRSVTAAWALAHRRTRVTRALRRMP